jgi:hypothetical protein
MFRRPACGPPPPQHGAAQQDDLPGVPPTSARRQPRSGSSESITLRLIAGLEQRSGADLTDLDSTEVFVW